MVRYVVWPSPKRSSQVFGLLVEASVSRRQPAVLISTSTGMSVAYGGLILPQTRGRSMLRSLYYRIDHDLAPLMNRTMMASRVAW